MSDSRALEDSDVQGAELSWGETGGAGVSAQAEECKESAAPKWAPAGRTQHSNNGSKPKTGNDGNHSHASSMDTDELLGSDADFSMDGAGKQGVRGSNSKAQQQQPQQTQHGVQQDDRQQGGDQARPARARTPPGERDAAPEGEQGEGQAGGDSLSMTMDEDAEVAQIASGGGAKGKRTSSHAHGTASHEGSQPRQQQLQAATVSPDPNAQPPRAASRDGGSREGSGAGSGDDDYSESFQEDEAGGEGGKAADSPAAKLAHLPARPQAPAVGPPSSHVSHARTPSRSSGVSQEREEQGGGKRQRQQQPHSPAGSSQNGSRAGDRSGELEQKQEEDVRSQRSFGRSSLGRTASIPRGLHQGQQPRGSKTGSDGGQGSRPLSQRGSGAGGATSGGSGEQDARTRGSMEAHQREQQSEAYSEEYSEGGEEEKGEEKGKGGEEQERRGSQRGSARGEAGGDGRGAHVAASKQQSEAYSDDQESEGEESGGEGEGGQKGGEAAAAAGAGGGELESRHSAGQRGDGGKQAQEGKGEEEGKGGGEKGGEDEEDEYSNLPEDTGESDEDQAHVPNEKETQRGAQGTGEARPQSRAASEQQQEGVAAAQPAAKGSGEGVQGEQQQQQHGGRPGSARSPGACGTRHAKRAQRAQHAQRDSDDDDDASCAPRIEVLPQGVPPSHYHAKHALIPPPSARARPASASAALSRRSSVSSFNSAASHLHHANNAASIYSGDLLHGSLVAAPLTPSSSQYGGNQLRPYSSKDRPASAAVREERYAEQVSDLMRRHPATWGVRDVGVWVEYIGMGQYRKKFLHHSVDGRLLLQASDRMLRAELGIGPMGHRRAILDAVATLCRQVEDAGPELQGGGGVSGLLGPRLTAARPMSAHTSPSPAAKPRRPASATATGLLPPDNYLGPALGKVTVYEQRAKLLFELDRAAQRAGQQRTLVQQLQHTATTSGDEVAHLRGLLLDLERRNKLGLGHEVGGLDRKARIPWRPSSCSKAIDPHPERFGKPGDDPSLDCTFQPRIRPASTRILGEAHGQQGAFCNSFMDRLEGDAKRREINRVEAVNKWYAPEVVFKDPMLRKNQQSKDAKLVSDKLMELTEASLSPGDTSDPDHLRRVLEKSWLSSKEAEYEAQVNRAVEEHAEEWRIDEHQKRQVLRLRGPQKVAALAGAIRTAEFMQRYYSNVDTRDERLKELQRLWWERYMGNPKQQKEAEDTRQAFDYYKLLGWHGDENITDERCLALLKRAAALKEARERALERAQGAGATGTGAPADAGVDWSLPPWSQDGLQQLQEMHGPPPGAPPATPAKRMSGPSDNNYLAYTVSLLARARWDELKRALGDDEEVLRGRERWSGHSLQLGLYRMIRTQRFIDFTEKNIEAKNQKMQETYESLKPKRRVLSKEQANEFYDRLLDDANKRNETKLKLAQEKYSKEHHIKESSSIFKKKK